MRKFLLLLTGILFYLNSSAQTFTWTGNEPIADLQSDTIVIPVSGLPLVIDSTFGIAHVCINITHTYLDDLTIRLANAHGDLVTLINNIGGSNDNFTNTCMGMDGTNFANANAPYSGIFIPIDDLNDLNDGHNPNGNWKLIVSDNANADIGAILSVSIEFLNNPPQGGGSNPPPPPGTYTCVTCLCPGGAAACDLLPDMTSSAKEIQLSVTESPGFLQISNATPNIGIGPLEIYALDSCFCDNTPVPCSTTTCPPGQTLRKALKQRVYQKQAGTTSLSYYDHLAGMMTFHPTHSHLHVDDFVHYTLRTPTSNPDATTWPIVGTGAKQSFCLINIGDCANNPGECKDGAGNTVTTVMNHGLGFQTGCGNNQGIYAGFYDVYGIGLNEPIPLNNVCNGNYYIVSITDPLNNFIESDETNNWVAVPVTLTQQSQQPVITASGATSFCAGDSVTLTCNSSSNYLWSNGATTQSITVNYGGTFTVAVNCGTSTATSAPVTTQVITASSSASVSIAITAGSIPGCSGMPMTFTATAVNGGASPSFQWKVNGSAAGNNSATFTTSFTSSNQVVTCDLISSSTCLINITATSNAINVTLSNCFCAPVYGTTGTSGCLDGDVIWSVKLNTLNNVTGSACPSGIAGFNDFTASSNPLHTTSLQAGSTYTLEVKAGQYPQGFRAWIDYDNNGVFTNSEAIGHTGIIAGSGQVGIAGSTGSVVLNIPCAVQTGLHRMRVRCAYNVSGSNMDACAYINQYGEAEDYLIDILPVANCSAPSGLSATNATTSGATLNWTPGCSETMWNVHLTLAGGSPPLAGNGTNPGVTVLPYDATGLKSGTTYNYWVQSHCGISNASGWAGPFTFTTLVNCATQLGISMTQPINIGELPCAAFPFINTQTNTTANCFSDSYAGTANQASPDVWYKFTISNPATVEINQCSTSFDTYLHLLNSTGTQIAANDDNGPFCNTIQASLSISLTPGTYYVVAEGYGTNTGAISTKINSNETCPVLDGKCFLQGYYTNTGFMRTVLFHQGVESNPLSNNVDSLIVVLHSAGMPYTILHSAKALLQTNGSFSCSFPKSVIGENYFISIHHRSSLETWSAAPVTFSTNTIYDFSTAANQAFGDNQIEVNAGVYAFYSGDVNQDNTVDAVDYILQDIDLIIGASGYYPTDITGDGVVDALDYILLDVGVTIGYSSAAP